MTHFTYILVDLAAVVVPFIFSFHPKIQFYKNWKKVFPGLVITATVFIIWDIIFTGAKVWKFNDSYLLGYYFFNIPIEEILFFICIPYACVFTYFCFEIFLTSFKSGNSMIISTSLLLFLGVTAIKFHSHLYTSVTFIGLFLLLFYNAIIRKYSWMKMFYFSYLILMIPFFICNGILTGTGIDQPVVMYNDAENMGIRLLTIPVEDIFYGMLLILMNVSIYEFLKRKQFVKY